ncbi:GNAT family N-acetyltransferase [Phytopseudomonas punonensis]|uniref:GNAT family N-acetyltransferase n=1 Tax=Phytopseudomonas punonensis TaxID=1220495 RepID=UPI001FCA0CC5|nr:GNAT family N-acetyltransferase [Pseudomonas punonensis]
MPALLELMRELAEFEDYLDDFKIDEQALLSRAFGPHAQCEVLVADLDGNVAGYAVVLEIPFTFDLRPTLLLKELYIRERHRRTGLGQALMQRVAMLAQRKGARRLKWDVLRGNERAQAFYGRLGGKPDSKWVAYRMDRQAIERLVDAAQSVSPSRH